MEQWSDLFHQHMQMPNIIEESFFLIENSIIATTAKELLLDEAAIGNAKHQENPRPPIQIGDRKFLYLKDIIEDQDGFSLSLYSRIKKEDDEEGASNVMFVARMDTLTWMGQFHNNNQSQVIPYVENTASYLYNYLMQSKEKTSDDS
ncbi:hypothetical protein NEFER03_1285 [Nematocida sp. LUAm3]|nr:hypothetical protein NEFER03_1285 [Nematocida sp. LUAm3]KAI5174093.1 hypothetical protein NEFER02_0560 [Nematocida sp. LUAm2]KAI5177164.1 hypothetical protein NEFER01_0439 [Nematocida sp. LUAm1]